MHLSSVNELKRLKGMNKFLPFKPRFINKLYANLNGYFWLPCHLCDRNYGGHEWYGSDDRIMKGICPECVLKTYNETGEFNIRSLTEVEIAANKRDSSLNELGIN